MVKSAMATGHDKDKSKGKGTSDKAAAPDKQTQGSITTSTSPAPKDQLDGASMATSPQSSKTNHKDSSATSPQTIAKSLATVLTATAKAIVDVGYMLWEIPKTLLLAGPSPFIASSLANILSGAQTFGLTWAGAIFSSLLLAGHSGKSASSAQDLFLVAGVLGLIHFSVQWLESINEYQAAVSRVDTRRHTSSRLIDGILGQKLAQISNKEFTNSAALAQANQWVPFNLGNFFFPILRQGSSLTCLLLTIALEAPAVVTACAAGMTIPSIISTMINTHLGNADEVAHAGSTSKGGKLSWYLTSTDFLRGIKIDGIAASLKKQREEFLNPALEADKRRSQISFYVKSLGSVVYASCFFASLNSIGSAVISGSMKSSDGLLLSAVVLQASHAVSGVVNSLVQLKLAAPYLRAIRAIEEMVENPPEVEKILLDKTNAPGLKIIDATVMEPSGRNAILSNVNVTIEGGKVTALFGPQGCGKTTFLDVLAGFRAPTRADQIKVIAGHETHNLAEVHPHEWLRSIAYCSQHPEIYSALTLRQNIVAATQTDNQTANADDEFIMRILEFIGEPGWSQKLDIQIGSSDEDQGFSGGQKQLISLARALFKRPKLLFLDEGFTGLPQSVTERMILGIRNLEGLLGWQPTVIMVSHDSRQALYADKIVLLSAKDRTVLGDGTHKQLYMSHNEYRREVDALAGLDRSQAI